MSLYVLTTGVTFNVVMNSGGGLTLYEPGLPEVIVTEAPADAQSGELDYSIPGNPLSEVV